MSSAGDAATGPGTFDERAARALTKPMTVVDCVEADYVELTVTRGNSHPRTPDFGAEIVSTVEMLTSGNRWTLESDASIDRPVGDRGDPMTDDDNAHANAVAAQLRLAEENGTLPEGLEVEDVGDGDEEAVDGE
jgi:hypothetical protein